MKFEERSESPVHGPVRRVTLRDRRRDCRLETRVTRRSLGTYSGTGRRGGPRRPSVAATGRALAAAARKLLSDFHVSVAVPRPSNRRPIKSRKVMRCARARAAVAPDADPGPPSREPRKGIFFGSASSGAVTTAISSLCTCSDAARARRRRRRARPLPRARTRSVPTGTLRRTPCSWTST